MSDPVLFRSVYIIHRDPGSSAKVFVLSFCSCLCKLVHGEDNGVLYNEAIVQWHHLAKSRSRIVEILISKISKDLCTVKPSQHQILAHYRRFEVCRVSRPLLTMDKIACMYIRTIIIFLKKCD